ncbi:MAG: DsbA family protein [Gammaproteobacteria bacterium]
MNTAFAKVNPLFPFLFFFLWLEMPLALANGSEQQDIARLKQELLHELLHSSELKQIIQEEIKVHEAQTLLNRAQPKQDKLNAIQSRIQKKLRPVSPGRDRIFGNPSAPVSIIEFSDFECPYCRKLHPVLKHLIIESEGKVNWVYRHFPLAFHKPNALREAEAAECADDQPGNDNFWRFTEALFLQPRRGKQDPEQIIKVAAQKSEIDYLALSECVKAGTYREKVQNDEKEALNLGLQGTPANVLIHQKTGKTLLRQGSASYMTLKKDIEKLEGVK